MTPENDPGRMNRLVEETYAKLKRIAAVRMSRERPEHTLRATELVHEAYLRLAARDISWTDQQHFLALTALAMRRILVEHARKNKHKKKIHFVPVDDVPELTIETDFITFDRALERLEGEDRRQADVVSLRFIVGLTVEEVAETLDVSPRTVKGDTAKALKRLRSWIQDD